MLNKTFITPVKDNYVPYTKTVNHNYAPTAEQAKYLDELKKEAWEGVVNVITHNLGDNSFSAAEVHVQHSYSEQLFKVKALFKLNGRVFDISAGINECSREEFFEKIAESLSAEITTALVKQLKFKAVG